MRPSELYSVAWPLSAFYFDRGIRAWANFVDRLSNEAELRVRQQMKKSRGDVDGFALQARQVAFNKILGLSVEDLYASPSMKGAQKNSGPREKIDLDKINGWPVNR